MQAPENFSTSTYAHQRCKNVFEEPVWVSHVDFDEFRATVPQLYKWQECRQENFRMAVASMAFHTEACRAVAEVQTQIV